MLEFVLRNEYKYQYDEFASQFANWYYNNKGDPLTKERALGILAIAFQSNLLACVFSRDFELTVQWLVRFPTLCN